MWYPLQCQVLGLMVLVLCGVDPVPRIRKYLAELHFAERTKRLMINAVA
jgi:hypothetical protein